MLIYDASDSGTRNALEDIAATQRDATLSAEHAAAQAAANAQWQQQLNQAEAQRLESHAIYQEQTGW